MSDALKIAMSGKWMQSQRAFADFKNQAFHDPFSETSDRLELDNGGIVWFILKTELKSSM